MLVQTFPSANSLLSLVWGKRMHLSTRGSGKELLPFNPQPAARGLEGGASTGEQIPVPQPVLCRAGCSGSQGAHSTGFPSKSCRRQPPCRVSASAADLRLGSHIMSFSRPSSSSQKGECPCQKHHPVISSVVPPQGRGVMPHRGVTLNRWNGWFLWFNENHLQKSRVYALSQAWQ